MISGSRLRAANRRPVALQRLGVVGLVAAAATAHPGEQPPRVEHEPTYAARRSANERARAGVGVGVRIARQHEKYDHRDGERLTRFASTMFLAR